MNTALGRLEDQLTKQLTNYFGDRKYFAIIYGSYTTDMNNGSSDLDVLIAVQQASRDDIEKLANLIITIHKENGLNIDNEVSFENKLVIEFGELEEAVNLKGFLTSGEKITIPRVTKNKEFLESKPVKLRLAFNALTSPHRLLGNDKGSHDYFKLWVEKNLMVLALNLLDGKDITEESLLNMLLRGPEGETGELYLGYKEYPSVINYLSSILAKEALALKYTYGHKSLEELLKYPAEQPDKQPNIFIGVAWPYVNGNLHIGHVAGYLLPADISARAFRLMGAD